LFPEEVQVDFLWTLGWDLADDFTSTATMALRRGGGVDGAIHGALKAPAPAWDRLLDAALAEYDEVDLWFAETGSKDQRRAHEGEFDAAYSAHVIDEPSERFAPSMNAIQNIVAVRRVREGYAWLTNHPRREALVRCWAGSIPYDSGESVSEELRALLLAAEKYNRPDVWQAIGRSRCLSSTALLQDGLTRGPVDELEAMWGALFGMYAPEQLEAVVGPVLTSAEWPRRAAMVFAVRGARMPDRHDHMHREVEEHRRRIRGLLVPNEQIALDACSDVLTSIDIPASVPSRPASVAQMTRSTRGDARIFRTTSN